LRADVVEHKWWCSKPVRENGQKRSTKREPYASKYLGVNKEGFIHAEIYGSVPFPIRRVDHPLGNR